MPRSLRHCPGGTVFHVLNRAVGRRRLFYKDTDYLAFLRVTLEALDRVDVRLSAFCLMPNHWHLLLWPRRDGDVSAFMRSLTVTHSNRYHAHYHSAGHGHLYQGRFKSFAVQDGRHMRTVWRYIERNPLRAGLVRRAEAWAWSSLAVRLLRQTPEAPDWSRNMLSDGLLTLPADWIEQVNAPQTKAEEAALRVSIGRGIPFGEAAWQAATAAKLGVSLRPRGRPGKREAADDAAMRIVKGS